MRSKLLQFLVLLGFHEIIEMNMINFCRPFELTTVEYSVNIVQNQLTYLKSKKKNKLITVNIKRLLCNIEF